METMLSKFFLTLGTLGFLTGAVGGLPRPRLIGGLTAAAAAATTAEVAVKGGGGRRDAVA